MYSVKDTSEFINAIKNIDERLKNVKISSVEVDKENRSVTYNFICDKAMTSALCFKIEETARSLTSQAFEKVFVNVSKIVANGELVEKAAFNFLKANYPSVSIFLAEDDIVAENVGDFVKIILKLTKDGADYVTKNGAMKKLCEHLSKNFCSEFVGAVDIKSESLAVDLLSEEVFEGELEKIEYRTIKVKDMIVVDDAVMPENAVYIEDVVGGNNGVYNVCGKITEIAERETKTGKPFFILHIDDTTGTLSGIYFTKKSTYDKIKKLQAGDAIIARGTLGDYNGRKSFTFEKINFCTFPDGFKRQDKSKKHIPRNYKKIFPTPASVLKISTVFDEKAPLPKELTEKTYVVFDLETTGLDVMNNGITEIGAVKISGGKISEQFTTLICPDYPITKEITEITGITTDMVKDAPKIEEVLPDFLKFTEYTTLVAHNAPFDTGFIRKYVNAEGYEIKCPVMDTVELSRKYLPELRRNDLKTVADHFNIVFRHHRALSDAYATAEAFIELMKIKAKTDGAE